MFKRPLCEMASGLILGILFMRYQNGIWQQLLPEYCLELYGIYGTIRSVTVVRKTVWQMPERGYTQPFVWDVFLYSFWQGHFIMHRMNHFVTHT